MYFQVSVSDVILLITYLQIRSLRFSIIKLFLYICYTTQNTDTFTKFDSVEKMLLENTDLNKKREVPLNFCFLVCTVLLTVEIIFFIPTHSTCNYHYC